MEPIPSIHSRGLTVVAPVLRAHAVDWDAQGQTIAQQGLNVRALTLPRSSPGLFGDFLSGYEGLVDAVSDRCGEAGVALADIADTLVSVANDYDDQESEHTHRLSGMTAD